MTEQEIATLAKAIEVLKTCRAEFATLKARLPEPYKSNAEKCCALIDSVLAQESAS